MATEAAQSSSSNTARDGGGDKLAGALAKRIAGSLLPGDTAFATEHLDVEGDVYKWVRVR